MVGPLPSVIYWTDKMGPLLSVIDWIARVGPLLYWMWILSVMKDKSHSWFTEYIPLVVFLCIQTEEEWLSPG